MWYQLYVDYTKGEYKITELEKKFNINIQEFEKKLEEGSTICDEVIYHNENYYFSKSKNALKRKLSELGWLYSHQMDEMINIEERIVYNLKTELARVENNINTKKMQRANILKRFSNYIGDYKDFLNVNVSKIHITSTGTERVGNNIRSVGLVTNKDVVDYCKHILSMPDTYVYPENKNWYIVNKNVEFVINPNNFTIITAHQK